MLHLHLMGGYLKSKIELLNALCGSALSGERATTSTMILDKPILYRFRATSSSAQSINGFSNDLSKNMIASTIGDIDLWNYPCDAQPDLAINELNCILFSVDDLSPTNGEIAYFKLIKSTVEDLAKNGIYCALKVVANYNSQLFGANDEIEKLSSVLRIARNDIFCTTPSREKNTIADHDNLIPMLANLHYTMCAHVAKTARAHIIQMLGDPARFIDEIPNQSQIDHLILLDTIHSRYAVDINYHDVFEGLLARMVDKCYYHRTMKTYDMLHIVADAKVLIKLGCALRLNEQLSACLLKMHRNQIQSFIALRDNHKRHAYIDWRDDIECFDDECKFDDIISLCDTQVFDIFSKYAHESEIIEVICGFAEFSSVEYACGRKYKPIAEIASYTWDQCNQLFADQCTHGGVSGTLAFLLLDFTDRNRYIRNLFRFGANAHKKFVKHANSHNDTYTRLGHNMLE